MCSEKGSTLKGKNLLPRGAILGSKFFPFRVDPFSEGRIKTLDRVFSPESVSISVKRLNVNTVNCSLKLIGEISENLCSVTVIMIVALVKRHSLLYISFISPQKHGI